MTIYLMNIKTGPLNKQVNVGYYKIINMNVLLTFIKIDWFTKSSMAPLS